MKRLSLLLAASLGLAGGLEAQGFGAAVAVSGSDVLVGDPSSNRAPGSVFVYRRATPAGRWTQRAVLTAPDSAIRDAFGSAIAADGDVAVVSARRGANGAGAVYVLRRGRTGTWSVGTKLMAADARSGDGFGQTVAIAGDLLLVSAPQQDSGMGAVYWFRRSGADWTAAGKIVADQRMARDRFGLGLAIDGDRILVGAPGRDRNSGVAFVFARQGDAWRQEVMLSQANLPANANFGAAVALAQGRAYLGAPGAENFGGAIYVMRRDSSTPAAPTWRDDLTLRAFDQTRGMRFGAAFTLAGGELVVGAPGADQQTGRVYRLMRDAEGRWTGAALLAVDSLQRGDFFGSALVVAGNLAAVTLGGADHGEGRVAIVERNPRTGALRTATVFADVAPLAPMVGAERRCTGRAGEFGCRDVDLMSFLPIASIGGRRGVRLNDIWGWVDPETRREYALVGRIEGTAFVDVTDPANPVYLGELPKTDSARAAAWRDIKVYRDHAFIVSDGAGPHGMQVFDLTQLRTVPRGRPVTFRPTAHYTRINSSHNIVINEESGFAYAVGASGGGETCGGGLHMIDIRDPRNPTFAGCFADTQTGRNGTGYSHDAQCVTYRGPDAQYRGREICVGSNETAISIADVTDKSRPVAVSRATYPNVAYTHQGWFTEDHRFFYVDDEGDEAAGTVAGTRTLIWDLTDLDDPVLAGQYIAPVRSIDHNLYVRGNLVFASNYTSGLRVLDITNRTAPREVGFFDTVPWDNDEPGFDGSWSNYPYFPSGNVVVTSISEGLFVVRARPTTTVP